MTITPIRPEFTTPVIPSLSTESPCPPFCIGDCVDRNDPDGPRYHGSDFDTAEVREFDHPGTRELSVSLTRLDDPGATGEPEIHLIAGYLGSDYIMSPQNARKLAAILLNAADAGDPLPLGETSVQARHIRVGDEILTEDGWQAVYFTMISVGSPYSPDSASLFTAERNGEDTDGWKYGPTDPVRVRRPMTTDATTVPALPPTTTAYVNAECVRIGDLILTDDGWQKVTGALMFVDSDQVDLYTPERDDESDGWKFVFGEQVKIRRNIYQVSGWCSRCRTNRTITGRRAESSTGVVRIRKGRCQTCGAGNQNPLLEQNGIAAPTARMLDISEVTR